MTTGERRKPSMNNLHTVQEVQRGAAASAERAHKMEAANEGNRSRRLVSTSPSCWSRAVRVGLVTLLGSVSLTKALAEAASTLDSIALADGARPVPCAAGAGRSLVGFAYPAPLPLSRARLRRRARSTGAFPNGGGGIRSVGNYCRVGVREGRQRQAPRTTTVSMGYGDGGVRNRGLRDAGTERRLLLWRCGESANIVLRTGCRLQGWQTRHRPLHASADEGGSGSGSQVTAGPRTAAAPTQTPAGGGELPAPAPAESEWESILRERLERKLRKPGRRRRAQAAEAAAAQGSPQPTFSSPSTQWQHKQHKQQQYAEAHLPVNDDHHKNVSKVDGTEVAAAATTPFSRATTSEAGAGTEAETGTDGNAGTWKEGLRGEASRGRRGGTKRVVRGRVSPPPLKRRPPGGPFGASKAVAWHAQQVVQSAVTPMQAMRAVLDRPLRSNYVSVSTAVNRVAKLAASRRRGGGLKGEEEPKYLGILLKLTEELVDADLVNARNLAQLLWSLAKLGNPEASSKEVLEHPEKGLREVGPLRFGSGAREKGEAPPLPLGTPGESRLPSLLAGKLSERAMECKPKELAMAAWGLAVLGERDENLLSAIAEEVSFRTDEFKGKELGNIVWAFAVLDFRDQEMLEAVAEVLSPEPLQWRGRVSWEWKQRKKKKARWGGKGRDNRTTGFWKATIDRTWAMRLPGGAPPARPAAMVMAEKARLAKTAEAASSSSSSSSSLAAGAATKAPVPPATTTGTAAAVDDEKDSATEGESTESRNVHRVGSVPTAGATTSPSAVAAPGAADGAPHRFSGVTGGGPSSPAAAAATGGKPFSAAALSSREHWGCASEVEVGSAVLTPQDIAMLSWGFSSLSQECLPCQPAAYRALAVLAKAARDCVGNFRPQDVSMVSLALARMSWDDPRLMKAMASRTTETLRAFKPQELSNTAWAYARLYVQDPPFWSALQKQAKRMLDGPGMRAQEIANLAWALAVMGEADVELLGELLRSAQAQRGDFTLIESHQLYQVYLLWGKDMPELWKELDGEFLMALKRRWTDNQQRTKRSSCSHLEVSQTLDLMQISHENESEHDIDIEVVGVGLASEDWDFRSFSAGTGPNPADPAEVRLKLALEVDGPAHFTKNTARPLGHMVLKHRTLSKMGWTVVSIPFLEWDPIPFWSSMERKRYLQRKLGITRTIFFGGTDCSSFKGWSTRLGKPSRFN